ncbi:MAG: polyprenol monophosphomannose synthase [Polyangiaceae bacterium]
MSSYAQPPEAREGGAKRPRTLVITPTYDERDNLPRFVHQVHEAAPFADVLVVDDASPDGTGVVADALAARDDRVRVLHRKGKLGLGTAYVAGFRYALTHGYDVALEMDADLSHDPRHIPELLRALDEGADVALGSRNVAGGGVEGWGMGRHFLSKGGSTYARTILGVPTRDLTTGFKAYTRRALEAIDVASLRSNGYSFQIETTYRALRRGLRVVEVPIVFVDRRVGKSKLSRRIFVEAIGEVWRLRWEAARGRI